MAIRHALGKPDDATRRRSRGGERLETALRSQARGDSTAVKPCQGILFFCFDDAGVFAMAPAIQYYTRQRIRWVFRQIGDLYRTMNGDDKRSDDGQQIGVVVKTKPKTKKPSMYKVLLLNDDYTPMEFVVHILEKIFNKNREQAVEIMLHVHKHGVGICGVFTYEVAETKVAQVIEFSRRHQHPLQCTMEKE